MKAKKALAILSMLVMFFLLPGAIRFSAHAQNFSNGTDSKWRIGYADYDYKAVWIAGLDGSEKKQIRIIAEDERFGQLLFSFDGKYLATTFSAKTGDGYLEPVGTRVIETESQQVILEIPGLYIEQWSKGDYRFLYTQNDGPNPNKYGLYNVQTSEQISVGIAEGEFINYWSSSGRYIVTNRCVREKETDFDMNRLCSDKSYIKIYDLERNSSSSEIPYSGFVFYYFGGVGISPDETKFAFFPFDSPNNQLNGHLIVTNMDGSNIHVYDNVTFDAHYTDTDIPQPGFNFSADGNAIYLVEAVEFGEIKKLDLRTGNITSIRTLPAVFRGFSPDGQWVVSQAYDGTESIYIESVEGNQRYIHDYFDAFSISWLKVPEEDELSNFVESNNRSWQISYLKNEDEGVEIWKIDSSGENKSKITLEPGKIWDNWGIGWSFDGSHLAYTYESRLEQDLIGIHVINADNRMIGIDIPHSKFGKWSKISNRFLYRPEGDNIYLYDMQTSTRTPLPVNIPDNEEILDWSPSDQNIVTGSCSKSKSIYREVSCGEESYYKIYDFISGNILRSITVPNISLPYSVFSPNANVLAFLGPGDRINTLNILTGSQEEFTSTYVGALGESAPSWNCPFIFSADGRSIIYVSDDLFNGILKNLDLETRSVTTIRPLPGPFISFSPDGEWLAYYGEWNSFRADVSRISGENAKSLDYGVEGLTWRPILEQNFPIETIQYKVSGWVVDANGNPVPDVAVFLDGQQRTTTDGAGYYEISGLSQGTYQVSVQKEGFTSEEAAKSISVPPDATGQDFVLLPLNIYSISGIVLPLSGVPVDGLTLSLGSGEIVSTGKDGKFVFTNLGTGTYTVTPSKEGYFFSPESQVVTIPKDTGQVIFTAAIVPIFQIQHFEINQAVQDDDNGVVLIANKPTLVRVYLSCQKNCYRGVQVKGVLHGLQHSSGQALGEELSINKVDAVLQYDNWQEQHDNKYATLNFILPIEWTRKGTIGFEIEVEGITYPDPDLERKEKGYKFEPGKKLRIAWVPMRYEDDAGKVHVPDYAIADDGILELVEMYPVSADDVDYFLQPNFSAILKENFFPSTNFLQEGLNVGIPLLNCSSCKYLRELNKYWQHMSEEGKWVNGIQPDRLYGWIPRAAAGDKKGGLCGQADAAVIGVGLPQFRVAAGLDICGPGTLAHEIGHLFNRDNGELKHPYVDEKTGCGGTTTDDNDKSYPNVSPQGSIIGWGVKFTSKDSFRIFSPESTFDFMTYCNTTWISTHNYSKLHQGFQDLSSEIYHSGREVASNNILPILEAEQTLIEPENQWIISGAISKNPHKAVFDPIFMIKSKFPVTLSNSGSFCLEQRDANEQEIDRRCFELAFLEPETGRPIAEDYFVVNVPAFPETRAIALVNNGTELGRVSSSPNLPTVNLISPVGSDHWDNDQSYTISWSGSDLDGQELHYSVSYSDDDGIHWNPIVLDTTDNQWEVKANDFPGSSKARIRVQVSDGFYSSNAISDPFIIATHKPQPIIIKPSETDNGSYDTLVVLQGYAYDLEDGVLENHALIWYSSLDGPLGDGRQVLANLSPGKHLVSLSAADSEGNISSDSVTIQIGQDNSNNIQPPASEHTQKFLPQWAWWVGGGTCFILVLVIIAGGAWIIGRRKPSSKHSGRTAPAPQTSSTLAAGLETPVQKGIHQVRSGHYAEGLKTLRHVLRDNPDDPNANLFAGWAAAQLEDSRTARQYLLRAQELGHPQASKALDRLR